MQQNNPNPQQLSPSQSDAPKEKKQTLENILRVMQVEREKKMENLFSR